MSSEMSSVSCGMSSWITLYRRSFIGSYFLLFPTTCFGLTGHPYVCTIVHSRRRESHRKKNARDISFALRIKSCSDHVMCVPMQGCPKSEWRLTCVRMQWGHWTNCALCPLLAVSCGDAGLTLFTLTVSSPRMDYRNRSVMKILRFFIVRYSSMSTLLTQRALCNWLDFFEVLEVAVCCYTKIVTRTGRWCKHLVIRQWSADFLLTLFILVRHTNNPIVE
jgi:hypothetical protein